MSLLAENQHGQRQPGPSPMTPESQLAHKTGPAIPQVLQTEPPRSTGSGNQALFRLIPDFQVTDREASRFLSIYASEYAPNFPFVMVPSAATAHGLHDRSPGLFWAIMTAVAPQSLAVQQRVKTWFRQYVADHVIVRQEKTLQLLQAILVHLAWGDFHFYINAEATNLLHLALALATDLRLDKSPESSAATIRSQLGEAWTALHQGGPSRLGIPHTLDDQRAVLGLYHLSSLISALFKRGPRFPWTPYLSQCCDALTSAREHPSDALLAALIRIQHIADGAYSILPTPGGTARTYTAPLDMAVAHARRQLDAFAGAQPETVQQDSKKALPPAPKSASQSPSAPLTPPPFPAGLFTTCHRVLTTRLYEPALATAAPAPTDPDALPGEPFLRADSLAKCLDSSRDSLAALLSVPPEHLCRLPLTASAALAFTVATTCRLLLLDAAPDWQPDAARATLDFATTLEGLQDNFARADEWAAENARRRRLGGDGGGGGGGENTRPDQYTSKLGWIRQWYMAKTGQAEQRPAGARAQEGTLMPAAHAEPWPHDVTLDFDFWPDLISMSDMAVQTFSGNTCTDG
ncbi:Fungal transcriptional regulatory protein, partial [Metarhizium brunneum ARSEF 3297]